MRRRKKLIIAILLVILFGLLVSIFATIYMPDSNGSSLLEGEKSILVCAIDESETRAGMGACDMAFIVTLNNGNITNYTAVYPGGMRHPTESEPAEYQAQGAGSKLLLHDVFYSSDNQQGMIWAKEIIEANTNSSIDAVVCINSKGVDAILNAANPLNINGQEVNASGIDIIREEQYEQGNSRGDAVLLIVNAVGEKIKDPNVRANMVNVAIDQYKEGNIIMYPEGIFINTITSKGLDIHL